MIEFFKLLATKAAEKAMENPTMQLGKDIMAGNAMQGVQNFAEKQFAPQLQFGRTVMDPNASMGQTMDAAFGLIGNPQAAKPQTVAPMVQPNQQGVSALLNTQDLPYGRGLPQGILPYMMG